MKTVVIMDMPKICIDCPLHFYNENSDHVFWCGLTRRDMDTYDIETYKPVWCPLQEAPEK